MRVCGWFLAALFVSDASESVLAGGGPENVLLLVNSNSVNSKTIANHYVALRNIPDANVVYIDWKGGLDECQAQFFWAGILKPAIKTIEARHLTPQIDYIVFSTDFPWRVNLKPLFPDDQFGQATFPLASTTGATFLWRYLQEKNPAMVLPIVNWYLASDDGDNDVRCQKLDKVESRGFRSSYYWDRDGRKTNSPSTGQRYFLSTMLGVTRGRGNTVEEVISYLRRAAAADATRPRGTIYFMRNGDIRSQTRHDCYDGVVQQLLRLGVSARIAPGKIPQGKQDVMGVMTGTANFDFASSGSTIQPGAICEHLTSLGGVLLENGGQTPLSEFLRYGAAGASGTVKEPLALQSKFPLPSLHLHYARGCSLAESFYQSIAQPYQLLIVGDPLCQPWAVPPTVTMDGIKLGQEVQGVLAIDPQVTTATAVGAGANELFVDGRLVARFPPNRTLQLDTGKLSDGYHELRIVATDAGPIETRGRLILPISVNNHGAAIEFSVSPSSAVAATGKVRIKASQPGAKAIVIRQYRRQVARIEGESGEVEVLAGAFGRGPVALQAESEGKHPAVSPPIRLEVQ